ncbi:hypothetical protein RSO01_89640 [Reyranella soli]|uniref:Uncharacterized protein n=1 Tax=Reyranella soli TaxID=1230389 RepID=A0A512NS57_9HYPH|nr:hypothetical protein RSO01_89640 [Reyranella soli]
MTNGELVAKIPAGATHRSPIAADGNVNMRYDSGHRRIGWVTIAGNVKSRELTLTSSAFPGCLYALAETAPSDPISAFSAELALTRAAEGRLEGTMRYPGGSAIIRLTRQ